LLNLDYPSAGEGPLLEYSYDHEFFDGGIVEDWGLGGQTVADDGTLFWNGAGSELVALEVSGAVRWRHRFIFGGIPNFDLAGNVFSPSGNAYAGIGVPMGLGPRAGEILWIPRIPDGGATWGTLIQSDAQSVQGLRPVMWENASPSNGVIAMHDATGRIRWTARSGRVGPTSKGVFLLDGTFIVTTSRVGDANGAEAIGIDAWDPDAGVASWSATITPDHFAATTPGPVPAHNSAHFFLLAADTLYKFAPDGGVEGTYKLSGPTANYSLKLHDGILYVLARIGSGLPPGGFAYAADSDPDPQKIRFDAALAARYGCEFATVCGPTITQEGLMLLYAFQVE
jgi:hypothetical protein